MTYLAHESCEATGRLFSVGGGRVAEVFIAEAPGFYKEDLTAEDVADNWAAVTAQEGYTVPAQPRRGDGRVRRGVPADPAIRCRVAAT